MQKLTGNLLLEREQLLKAGLNTLDGTLEELKPITSSYTTFPAYYCLVAYSHLIMSRFFDSYTKAGGVFYAMDTDSLIGNKLFIHKEEIGNGLLHKCF